MTSSASSPSVKSSVLYPGSFDPVTLGHVDVIARLARRFERVYVLVADNPRKSYVLNREERMGLVKASTAELANVEVLSSDDLTVNVAKRLNVNVIARSVRTVNDWEYEYAMAYANQKLAPGVDTFFIMASPEYGHISSSLVREVAAFGGDVSAFVSSSVAEALKAKFKKP